MRAVVVQDDASLRWDEVPDPRPGPEEVVLRVRATAVNRADLLQRKGLYPPPAGAPPWMGLEAAGTIEEAGPRVRRLRPGETACALLAGGGYAEKVAVPQDQCLPIPRGLSFLEAAALPEAFATAYLNLFLEAKLTGGETVLIHAGASGVGTAAIQLARSAGARVVTTVGTEAKVRGVRALGADVVIRHDEEDVTIRLREIAAGGPAAGPGTAGSAADSGAAGRIRGLDVVLDCLGGADLAAHLPLLNPGGRWVVIALMKGRSAEIDLRPLLSRRLRLIGSTLRSRPVAEKGRILEALRRDVWPKLEAGEVRPVIHAVLPITQAAEAHAMVERNENIGKVVLSVPGE